MANSVEQSLAKLFQRHRIIFWYDREKNLKDLFNSLILNDIEKIELHNNVLSVKNRVLREERERKFLLYHEGPAPKNEQNWMLDVLLAHGEFRADQIGLWLSEMELELSLSGFVEKYRSFFSKKDNRDAFRTRVNVNDSENRMQLKMLSIFCRTEVSLEAILLKLLFELANEDDKLWHLLEAYDLESFFWDQMTQHYSYQSKSPSLRDFVYLLFQDSYAMMTGGDHQLNRDALVFLQRWQDSSRYKSGFEHFSDETAHAINVGDDLAKRTISDVLGIDYFKAVDQRILHELVSLVSARTISHAQLHRLVQERRSTYWYSEYYQSLYEALELASLFFQNLTELNFYMGSMAQGVENYSKNWFKIDQLYRKYICAASKAGEATLMNDLSELVENHYVNKFLFPLGNSWQAIVDKSTRWDAMPCISQRSFFNQHVSLFPNKGHKVCVIISDALRYEIAEELQGLIQQEDRFSAKLEPMFAVLPSFTQLGMAALLPGKTLEIVESSGSPSVSLDGHKTAGIINREKILRLNQKNPSIALSTDSVLKEKRLDLRTMVRDHDIIYIFHNHIDATGHSLASENEVFVAAEETLEHLLKVIKKLAGNNVNNFLLTTDHGFLYQQSKVAESDFHVDSIEGSQIVHIDRRYVIGKKLTSKTSLTHFHANELGLAGDLEFQFPKSVNRIRKRGSCIQFVHGGTSLQECVIPVLSINKKRSSDVSLVDIDILQGSVSSITVGHLPVTLYQTEPLSDKLQERHLRIGLYSKCGELISSSEDLSFAFESEHAREREYLVQLTLTRDADKFNNEEVILRLESKIPNTNQYTLYKSANYMLRRSFISDFEF